MVFKVSWVFVVGLAVATGAFECGDCLTIRNVPGCSVQEVSDCVCASDSFCCLSGWSSFCVADIFTFNCDQFCPADPAEPPSAVSISGGWIFTIVVGSLFGVYCVLGFLVNWCCVADPSPPFPECLPHYGFWKEVPGWARDGCRLVGGKVLSV